MALDLIEGPGPARLGLVASSIAGRTLNVAPARTGEIAWTDGSTVYVNVDDSADGQRTAVIVQSALLASGSLAPGVLNSLSRRPTLTRRYLAVEAHRALSSQREVLPGRIRQLIDHETAIRSDSPESSLHIAQSRTAIEDPPATFGTIHPRRMILTDADPTPGPVSTLESQRGAPQEALEEFIGDEQDQQIDVFSSPVGGGGGLGSLLKRLLSDVRSSASGEPGADAPTHWSRSVRPSASGRVKASKGSVGDDVGAVSFTRAAVTYPEWDIVQRQYKPDWCTVIEADLKEIGSAPLRVPDSHQLRRALSPVGLEFERRHRQPQGDDVDVDAAVEARVDWRTGHLANEAVYLDVLRRRRDLSALVLLDVSGSAAEMGVTGKPVHEVQRNVAAVLTRVLYTLGDRVALYGFRSQGRSAVHVLPVKRFDEVLRDAVWRRLSSLTPGAYTRLGAAIRHGTSVLEREAGTARRLLIVISDGLAYDHGYERAYGEADARRALVEARDLGIGCLCLSVGARTDEVALGRVFGTAAHAAIDDPRELPPIIGRLFTYALAAAARQQMSSSRQARSAERLLVERTS